MADKPGAAAAPAPAPAPAPAMPTPPMMANAIADGMYAKATMPWWKIFVLALTGGAFIALGFIFSVTSQQDAANMPLGLAKVIGGLVFSSGLMLVVMSGSDLFTGTTLTVMPALQGRLRGGRLLGHWGVSYLGNLIGSVLMAALMFFASMHTANGGAWGLVVLNSVNTKVGYAFHEALLLGLLANFAVCLAVWMAFSGKSTTDKVLAIAPPIALFVATGFEHSVANMFLLPMGWMIEHGAGQEFWSSTAVTAAERAASDYSAITLPAIIFKNLLPVTIGNIIGGALFVGVYFWLAYLKKTDAPAAGPAGARRP
ncbi:formate/nitrite transporter family protein [Brachybacterium sp. EF45031]|uniref:formate/nitrite family transporter n=1 Tax=Brachybacterium sillae TaxID=2810536 RepID=UPI00217E57FF|nr:formate/nitrite family transporter [Brachybacterium sillae]MCS6712059.1 formate/nitrite transporter family protein [Brachybacterium sillae]